MAGNVYSEIGTGNPLLELRRAMGEIGEAFAVAGRQTRDDTPDSADRLVNNLPMLLPESFERICVRGHKSRRDVETLGLNQRGLIRLGMVGSHCAGPVHHSRR